MLEGKEKVQLLVSLLGESAPTVLSKLKPEHSALLTESIGEKPVDDPEVISGLLDEVSAFSDRKNTEKDFQEQSVAPNADDGLADIAFESEAGTYDSENFDVSFDEGSEELKEDSGEPRKRTSREIAVLLEKQRTQLAAFILNQIDEEERLAVMEHLSPSARYKIEGTNVESLPISQSVFDKIVEDLYFKKEEPEEPSLFTDTDTVTIGTSVQDQSEETTRYSDVVEEEPQSVSEAASDEAPSVAESVVEEFPDISEPVVEDPVIEESKSENESASVGDTFDLDDVSDVPFEKLSEAVLESEPVPEEVPMDNDIDESTQEKDVKKGITQDDLDDEEAELASLF